MKKIGVRKIIRIDEDKCDGCGQCVPVCVEGAIRIVDGKARLAENLCDALGNCLGACPRDAITIEERPAEEFDARAVKAAAERRARQSPPAEGGCPGSQVRVLRAGAKAPAAKTGDQSAETGPSQLRHWPVQVTLLPEAGDIWAGADVLMLADCVPVAMPDFQGRLLAGKTVAVACPKLDDPNAYVAKLARIFTSNDIRSVTVAHMEVPCCFGLSEIIRAAMEQSGRTDIPVHEVNVGIDGRVKT